MSENIHYEDSYFQISSDNADDRYITSTDAVMVVPLTEKGEVILIREPSPAFNELVLMLPGGTIDANENPRVSANRELQEEIDLKARTLNLLCQFRPWTKYLKIEIFVYLGRNLVDSPLEGDEGHIITTQHVPLNQFEQYIASGELRDSTKISAFYMTRQFLRYEKSLHNGH